MRSEMGEDASFESRDVDVITDVRPSSGLIDGNAAGDVSALGDMVKDEASLGAGLSKSEA